MVRIELQETPFYARSVSTFVLPEGKTEYVVYPDVLWRYDALRSNTQAEPVSVVANVEMNGKDYGQRMRTFSMRSINECLLGYNQQKADGSTNFVSTKELGRPLRILTAKSDLGLPTYVESIGLMISASVVATERMAEGKRLPPSWSTISKSFNPGRKKPK